MNSSLVLLHLRGICSSNIHKDRGATLRLWGGDTVSDYSILGEHKTLFLLTLYNSKNIGGRGARAPHSLIHKRIKMSVQVSILLPSHNQDTI